MDDKLILRNRLKQVRSEKMLWPMLVFRDTNKFTLQIGLNTLLTPYGNNYDLLIAGSMFGIIPILAIYLIFQKYLIDGMTAGAVKG